MADVVALGRRAVAVRGDVGVEGDVLALFDIVERALGPVEGLVNSAGITGLKGRLEALTVEAIEAVLRTNVVGSILTCREAVRRMSTRHGGKGGAIVNVSSGSANLGNPVSACCMRSPKGR